LSLAFNLLKGCSIGGKGTGQEVFFHCYSSTMESNQEMKAALPVGVPMARPHSTCGPALPVDVPLARLHST